MPFIPHGYRQRFVGESCKWGDMCLSREGQFFLLSTKALMIVAEGEVIITKI